MIRELVRRFIGGVSERLLNIWSFNYTDRSTGLRNPDSPVGVLIQDSGIVQLFAGSAKLAVSLDGTIHTLGPDTNLHSSIVQLNPSTIENFRIMGKTPNKEIFEGRQVATILKDLGDLEVIGPETVVVENKIVGTRKLSDYLEGVEFWEGGDVLPEPEYLKLESITKEIGIELPKWI